MTIFFPTSVSTVLSLVCNNFCVSIGSWLHFECFVILLRCSEFEWYTVSMIIVITCIFYFFLFVKMIVYWLTRIFLFVLFLFVNVCGTMGNILINILKQRRFQCFWIIMRCIKISYLLLLFLCHIWNKKLQNLKLPKTDKHIFVRYPVLWKTIIASYNQYFFSTKNTHFFFIINTKHKNLLLNRLSVCSIFCLAS